MTQRIKLFEKYYKNKSMEELKELVQLKDQIRRLAICDLKDLRGFILDLLDSYQSELIDELAR